MSLLDNFSNYSSMLSFALINSPKNHNDSPTNKHSPRHHSLFQKTPMPVQGESINESARKGTQSKSIDKMFMCSATITVDPKTKILHKMVGKLQNKVRKSAFQFWVCLELRIKGRKKKVYNDKIDEGIEKTHNFIEAYQAKFFHSFCLNEAFQRVHTFSKHRFVANVLKSTIGAGVSRNY